MDELIALQQQIKSSKDEQIKRRTRIHQGKIARDNARRKYARVKTPLPQRMLAHGDSWFDYPLSGNVPFGGRTDIEACLEYMGSPRPYILNLSEWGDATTVEMSLPKQEQIITALTATILRFLTVGPPFVWGRGSCPRLNLQDIRLYRNELRLFIKHFYYSEIC
jgi:hypothetical protein